jgi:N-acyl-D-aspartate/D-glutamate deacylase
MNALPPYDLLIQNGMLYDGEGGDPFQTDIAIQDGQIKKIAPSIQGDAHQTIDAKGLIVTPGFIDLHTHYDGQVSWDTDFRPSINHGVSTVVMGNCGVGFAPVSPNNHDALIRLMEGVEDIPGTALHEGINWNWESFPQYLDAIDFPHTIDFAAQIVHDPLRMYVMGERSSFTQEATDDDIQEMKRLTRQALEAGAVGFSTGRSDVHRSSDGEWTPSSEATQAELKGIASAFEGLDYGVLQAVNDFNVERQDPDAFDREFDLLEDFVEASQGRPFSLSLMQRDLAPKQWKQILERSEKALKDKKLKFHVQVAPRGIGITLGLQCTFHPFIGYPSYKAISHLSLKERVAQMSDPAFKKQLLSESSEKMAGDGSSIPPLADLLLAQIKLLAFKMFLLGDSPDYEQPLSQSIGSLAHKAGVDPLDQIYDILLEKDGQSLIYFPIYNYTNLNYNAVYTMMNHPQALMGLTDGGAHVGTICDASFPTYLITHWTRDRETNRLELPKVIKMLSADPADYMGFIDRGRIKEGYKANINIIDYEQLRLFPPKMIQDLPAGGQRLLQEAQGYRALVVNGEVVLENDQLTGKLPGRLVRSTQF